ncbi:stage V sporulation family protein [Effusibacillus lacus]|nr:stage V sporulation protein SpoVM [Effusibacillus lacus]TCS76563.1 stage V sporulation family protein [Effusibacillus lacus]
MGGHPHPPQAVCAWFGLIIRLEEGSHLRFYTIKLPRFLGGIVKAMLSVFQKKE